MKFLILVFLLVSPVIGAVYLESSNYPKTVNLTIESQPTSSSTSSNIFVINGFEVAHIKNLINLMGEHDLSFYQSPSSGTNQAPDGLIGQKDVVLIKINCQWSERGGTNTDLLKELIQSILDHPDGFTGEIIVADNGQGRGSMNWAKTNSEDKKQSAQDVADFFSENYKVSTFLWDSIAWNRVEEYSAGNNESGYIVYDIPDEETGIYVSYPKFETIYGTKVSFKHGIWNGIAYEKKLKVINFPV